MRIGRWSSETGGGTRVRVSDGSRSYNIISLTREFRRLNRARELLTPLQQTRYNARWIRDDDDDVPTRFLQPDAASDCKGGNKIQRVRNKQHVVKKFLRRLVSKTRRRKNRVFNVPEDRSRDDGSR